MNIIKKIFYDRIFSTPPPFPIQKCFRSHCTYKKNQYQNIQKLEIHLYTILRASSLQKNNETPILPTT